LDKLTLSSANLDKLKSVCLLTISGTDGKKVSAAQDVTGDLKQTQAFLGHSSIGITSDVYVHLQPDSEVQSTKKLEETFFSELCSTVLKTRVAGQKGW
jgi:hypothetical protein